MEGRRAPYLFSMNTRIRQNRGKTLQRGEISYESQFCIFCPEGNYLLLEIQVIVLCQTWWSYWLRLALVWPKVTALRQVGRNGDKLCLSPFLLESVPVEGDADHLSLSLSLSLPSDTLKGKDPLTWVQASGLYPCPSWHWGRTPAAPKPPSGQDGHLQKAQSTLAPDTPQRAVMKSESSLWHGRGLL